jgi:hypothetical protein
VFVWFTDDEESSASAGRVVSAEVQKTCRVSCRIKCLIDAVFEAALAPAQLTNLLRELLPTFDCPLLRPHPLERVEGSSASALPVVSQKLNVWADRW